MEKSLQRKCITTKIAEATMYIQITNAITE